MKWVSNLWEKIPGTPWQRALTILLGVLLLLFIAVMVCKPVETCITQLLDTDGKYETLRALGFGMGGILIVLQFLIANRRTDAAEKTAEEQVKATKEQAKANENTEKGQRQERLKNAIEHLGNDRDSVRLGGAYELFHLAEDAEDLGQRQTVLDILCAHIRWTTGEPKYREEHQSKPSEEVQSLLTLLFVRKHEVFAGLDINLQDSWLNGSNLAQARLEKANLVGAWLHGAHFFEAQLHGADLFEAQLHGAHFLRARLHGAHLFEAQLHGADLLRARLHGAYLRGAQLHGAILWGAQLHGARLWGAQLHEADLSGAQLHGASSRPGDSYEDKPFEAVINTRIGKESDLSGAIFEGGLTREDVDSIGKGLPDKQGEKLRANLEEHIVKPVSQEFPENSEAIIGTYTKEKAAQWIAEYNSHVSRVWRR